MSRVRTMAFLCLLSLALAASPAAQASDGEELWQPLGSAGRTAPMRADGERWLALDEAKLVEKLRPLKVPGADQIAIALPTPDGTFRRFLVTPSIVMAPELMARFPQIRTFEGHADDGSPASVRLETGPNGFGAMIFGGKSGVEMIERDRGSGLYLSYSRERFLGMRVARCMASGVGHFPLPAPAAVASDSDAPDATGPTLRTYRTAIGATGEYTAFFGGTVGNGQAAIVTAVNRINQIYETELGLRLVLVANNNLVVFTNPATDGYTNNDGFILLDENQAKLDAVIGSANYDFGHVFSTGGGGVAEFESVCVAGGKARGVTGLPSPVGDPFYVDYVAHEMGHQLGGDHTFNSTSDNCGFGNRESSAAYEPGSGSTIMSYAGICPPENLQNNSDPFFHIRSLVQIHGYSQTGGGAGCGSTSATGNGTPVVAPVTGATIPMGTPFMLTASATDPNGHALTYDWQQYNLGAASPPMTDNGSRPIFRAFAPTTSPTRLFPKLGDILAGTSSFGESLPTTTRTLAFRVAVRDNRSGGGGVQWSGTTVPVVAETMVSVTNTAGPFTISNLNSTTTLTAGSSQSLTWNVANTTASPVNCANVEIAFSTNAGASFSVVTASTANDGSENFVVPGPPTTQGRVRVRCASSIFFDINNANLIVAADTAPPTVVSIDDGDTDNMVTVGTLMTYTITFNEQIAATSVQAMDFSNAGTSNITKGVPVVVASTVTLPVTPTSAGTLILSIPLGATITDVAGNPMGVPINDNEFVTVLNVVNQIFMNGFE